MDITPLALNGHTYTMRPMDPLDVLQDAGRLGDILSPVVAGLKKDDYDMGIGAVLLKSGGGVVAQLKNPEFLVVVEHLFDSMAVDGKEFKLKAPGWKLHFMGKVGDLPQVLAWALKEQFGDFFVGVRDGLTKNLSSLAANAD